MTARIWIVAALASSLITAAAHGQESTETSARYRALKCPAPSLGTTWAVLEHDGANREVDPYLSSLGQGESGAGVIASPPFELDTDTIRFTICGHDGPDGKRGENYVALVDARKGTVLQQTMAPGNDALQERTWEVSQWRGRAVRIEARDGVAEGAFAWLGVGSIDAGPALQVDFRNGLPDNWSRTAREAEVRYEFVTGAVPFQRNASIGSLIPDKGEIELPCGFAAQRVFLLGCTVPSGTPLDCYGAVEFHYRSGAVDIFPLIYGFTLEGQGKLLSPSKAMYLGRSGDPFQYTLALAPASEVIDKIRLVSSPTRGPIPQITAITCETTESHDQLLPLPQEQPTPDDTAWIASHTITSTAPDRRAIEQELRRAHRLSDAEAGSQIRFKPHRLDSAFRSEGVAVADMNGDGQVDIVAGNVYYAGPDWTLRPMLGAAQAFPPKEYSDAFLCFDDDINRDGATDLVVVGFPGQQTHWLANPGKQGAPWPKHLAVERTGNESPHYLDVDGDGVRELVFMQDDRCALARPAADPTELWTVSVIAGPHDPGAGHGLGVGDVNQDGRLDILIPAGWWEQPAQSGSVPWPFHAAAFYGGAQLCVCDFDGDGDNDVLGSSAHDYGIGWAEQTPDGWQTHMIDQRDSQTHAIHLADLNGDGLLDFVTGKRFWAHFVHDPGSHEPSILCWYELSRHNGQASWIKHQIHDDSGVGLHFRIVDVDGDGRLDIVTANKKGVFYFEQLPAPQ